MATPDPLIVRIRTPQISNPFARRAVEDALLCDEDSPLRGADFLVDYQPGEHLQVAITGSFADSETQQAIQRCAGRAHARAVSIGALAHAVKAW